MRRMLQQARAIHSFTEAIWFLWEYFVPPAVAFFLAMCVYWALDRQPARTFINNPEMGIPGYITPERVIAGTPASVHWFVQWERGCDKVDLFQEIVIETQTSAPQVIRLEKISVRSRSHASWFYDPPPEWIQRDFFVPQSANLCTKERCAPVNAYYRATLTDYCNPVHKLAFPIETESPKIKFQIHPSVALPPLSQEPK